MIHIRSDKKNCIQFFLFVLLCVVLALFAQYLNFILFVLLIVLRELKLEHLNFNLNKQAANHELNIKWPMATSLRP